MSITSLSDNELALRKRVAELENKNVPRGCLTANLGDLEVALEYEFDPGEPMVMYYRDGSGHPGSPPQATLCNIWVAGTPVDPEYFDADLVLRWEAEALQYENERNEK